MAHTTKIATCCYCRRTHGACTGRRPPRTGLCELRRATAQHEKPAKRQSQKKGKIAASIPPWAQETSSLRLR